MKKIFGIALVLAVLTTLCFGTVALADDPDEQVYIEWVIDGPGSLTVNTEVYGSELAVLDHMDVSTEWGGYSSGNQTVTSDSSRFRTSIDIDRGVYVDDGQVYTETTRFGSGPVTTYYANLDTEGTGGLTQSFHQDTIFSATVATMDTYIVNNPDSGEYSMGAGFVDDYGSRTFRFDIWSEGDGSGYLNLDTLETPRIWFIPPMVFGDYNAYATGSSAGFEAASSSFMIIDSFVQTPSIYQEYDYSGAGSFFAEGTADSVYLEGDFWSIR